MNGLLARISVVLIQLIAFAGAGIRQATMRAIGLRTGRDGITSLEEFECEVPELQPRDILVRVVASAMNHIDCELRTKPGPLQNPVILGFDGAGVVEAVGADVTRFTVGKKVYFIGSIARNGTNAEFVIVDEGLVADAPKKISLTEAASIPLAALTAHESLFESAGFETHGKFGQNFWTKGKRLLVLPGAGGVGRMAIQIAKKLTQLYVVATASRPESMEACRELGADIVINHSQPLLSQLESNGLGTESIDYILNGHDISMHFDEYIDILRPFGRIIEIAPTRKDLPMYKMQHKRLSYVWESVFARALHNLTMDKHGVILDLMSDFIDGGKLHPPVQHILPWSLDSFVRAQKMQEMRGLTGKIVITRESITQDNGAECKAEQ